MFKIDSLVKNSEIMKIQEYLESQAVENVYNEVIIKDMNILKKMASEYIEFLNKELNTMQQLKEIDEHRQRLRAAYRKKNINKNGFMEYPEYKNYTEQRQKIVQDIKFQDIIVKTENFQKKMFEIMGKKIRTIFVDETVDKSGKIQPLLYELEASDLFSVNSTEFGKFNTRASFTSKVEKTLLNKEEKDTKYDELVETYNAYIRRRDMSRRHFVMVYNPLVAKSVIGNYDKKWSVQKTGQMGDIKEAFASMYFSKQYQQLILNNEETNLYLFMKAVASVDATSGALEGDIVLDNIEYSIKSAGASYQSIYSFYKIAKILEKDVTNNPKILQHIKDFFKNPPRNQITNHNGINNFLRARVDQTAKYYYREIEEKAKNLTF